MGGGLLCLFTAYSLRCFLATPLGSVPALVREIITSVARRRPNTRANSGIVCIAGAAQSRKRPPFWHTNMEEALPLGPPLLTSAGASAAACDRQA